MGSQKVLSVTQISIDKYDYEPDERIDVDFKQVMVNDIPCNKVVPSKYKAKLLRHIEVMGYSK